VVAEGCDAGVTPVWDEAADPADPGAVFFTTVVHFVAVAETVVLPPVVVVPSPVASVLNAVDVRALEVAPAPVR
jgi:hypothetical protein